MNDHRVSLANNISVSLDTSVTPRVLKVDDTGANRLDRKPFPQPIHWNLTGPLARGEFVPLSDCRPGFEWLSWPPPGQAIFSEAQIGPGGNSVSLTDMHDSEASDGTWIYKLRVRLDGVIYETVLQIAGTAGVPESEGSTLQARAMLSEHPVIINR